jgi:hypothetical protein
MILALPPRLSRRAEQKFDDLSLLKRDAAGIVGAVEVESRTDFLSTDEDLERVRGCECGVEDIVPLL